MSPYIFSKYLQDFMEISLLGVNINQSLQKLSFNAKIFLEQYLMLLALKLLLFFELLLFKQKNPLYYFVNLSLRNKLPKLQFRALFQDFFLQFILKMTETLQRKFVKPSCISQSLKCAICSQVYIEATRLYCSHTFCNECIKQCLKSRDNCPICRVIIDKKNMGPDRIAQNIINQLEVFCPVQDCPWKGMNQELEAHYDKCEWRNRDREVKTGKSHKKVKTFNIGMFKDEQVEEKINFNQFKGSLGARIGMGIMKREPKQINEGNLKSTDVSKKEQQNKESKDKGNYDFLENLLFG